MRGSSQWRRETWGSGCDGHNMIVIPIYSGGPRVQVNKRCVPAFIQLGQIFLQFHYIVRRIGGYNCRKITGGTSLSSHAYGMSIDVNDDTNPYRHDRLVTDMSLAMVQAGTEIRTFDGLKAFRWGGDWDGRPDTPHSNYDAMHWECILTPNELEQGFVSRTGIPNDILSYPTIRRGAIGSAVVTLQRLLKMNNTTGTGTFGPRTEAAVKQYQALHGLVIDGIVGLGTWQALLTDQPALTADHPDGVPSPLKLAVDRILGDT